MAPSSKLLNDLYERIRPAGGSIYPPTLRVGFTTSDPASLNVSDLDHKDEIDRRTDFWMAAVRMDKTEEGTVWWFVLKPDGELWVRLIN